MFKLLHTILFALFSLNVSAQAFLKAPVQTNNPFDLQEYGWLSKYNTAVISMSGNDQEAVIANDEIIDFAKLKFRSVLSKVRVGEYLELWAEDSYKGHIDVTIHLMLIKYNESSDVYYGSLTFYAYEMLRGEEQTKGDDFMITFPVANTTYELRNDIKDTLSTMIEKFAKSKYHIEDISKRI